MFSSIAYLQNGNQTQQQAYNAIKSLGIMDDLVDYHPILCGTIPIGIDIVGSDLDIILEAYNIDEFEKRILMLYGNLSSFKSKKSTNNNSAVYKANFFFEGFEFELYAQPIPVREQNAYLHMMIEHSIIQKYPSIKEKVLSLKQQGYKTEPAFCKVLGIKGDPYEELLKYGRLKKIIQFV